MVMKHQDIHAHFDKLESTKYILLEGKAVLLDSFDRRNHFTTSGRVVGVANYVQEEANLGTCLLGR